MAQKTDLNISPYYDDFDRNKDFYKVLFKPGYPVQARELTTLQSIFQNQVEFFGKNIFKEGSMVLPGALTFDNQFSAVKLNSTSLGVDVSLYIKSFIGKKVTGQLSGVSASIQYVALTSDSSSVDELTIYVKYSDSGNDYATETFQDGEALFANENVTYGNTTINAGTEFASLISEGATSTGSSVSIDEGVYFVRGIFANVSKQTLILDYYTNTPSYRVGLKVEERLVNAKDDDSLYDNAKGFTNYAAPGADRFKLSLTLTKKPLTDFNDTDFIELLRVDAGKIKKVQDKTVYNVIRDYIAERTYEESGHYSVEPFDIKIVDSLNNRLGNDGLYLSDETTDSGNEPSNDLMCIQISPGKAYVAGYDVENQSTQVLDVSKPRATETVSNSNIPFEMGHLLRVNNVSGALQENGIITLNNQFSGDTPSGIGSARVYTFNLTDAAYENASSQWDLYLYDIQTYTSLTFNRSVTSSEVPKSSFIQGKSSGASGYAVAAGSGSTLNLSQTSGTFVSNEQIIINGIDSSLTVTQFTANGIRDIKSISATSGGGFPAFSADTVLARRKFGNGISEVNISGSTVTSPGKLFSGVNVGDIIRYQNGSGDETFNRVTAVSSDLSSLTVTNPASVSGVFVGTVGSGKFKAELGVPELKNNENAYLYAKLPEGNISSVNFTDSQLSISRQITGETTDGAGQLTFDLSAITGITSAFFETFDQERYSIHYTGGGIGTVTSDSFVLDSATNTVTISGLETSESSVVVNTTLKKNGIRSKIKEYTRSSIRIVNLSKYAQSGSATSTSVSDGLTFNDYYGLRVQDKEISLNYPDVANVLAVYESTDSADPVLDRVEFSSVSNIDSDAIVGETIVGSTSGAIARVVLNSSTSPSVPSNNLGIVYLNRLRFSVGENVVFEESNITSSVQSITLGKYKNITNSFVLDKAQKDEYYDYSRLVRNNNLEPSRRLLVVFDHYTVPSSDDGDVFTVLSYDADRFDNDIPSIGVNKVRASDTLDFRPRVQQFTVTDKSPFDFDSRNFGTEPKYTLKPGESSLVGYDFYLPRIDKLYLDKFGNFILSRGISARRPKEPVVNDTDLMELATINLPPYLYDVSNASITLFDNRRYTMRDIGTLEDRIENLERVTSLSLLEVNTESLRIEDADGNNRFKSGFFVDDFNDKTLLDNDLTTADVISGELRPRIFSNSLQLRPLPATEIAEDSLDLDSNFSLLDANVQKTGKAITLKYDSVGWIEQPLATRVENVNPFHVIEYNGTVKLSPSSDVWTRTVRLPSRSIDGGTVGHGRLTRVDTRTRDVIVSSSAEKYIRSRNVSVFARNLKPLSTHYQFLDNHSNVDFVPKLIEIANDTTLENYGSSGVFSTGETVRGYFNDERIIQFRLASSNHKEGTFNSPSNTYNINPYVKSENVPSAYSQSSKVLNVDLASLSQEAQGSFFGYILKGVKLVGQTSGAVAYVKDIRLITDNYGDLLGSFFIRDPNTFPAPDPRILTGKKTYTLSNSSSNQKPLPGSKLISSANTSYTANGTFQVRQTIRERVAVRYDPLAQSFVVGKDIDAPDLNGQNDDDNGAYLTKLDLYFANKPSGNEPVEIQIRTVELGVPTLNIVGEPKTLIPSDITTSTTGEIATTVTFDYPIFLAPGREYAVVLLAPTTDEYEVWIAKMGEKTANTQSLPNAESVIYSKQFAMGSLFKSQNGSTWTPAQDLDLKFKLYKAKFASTSGIAYFGNPPLDESNGYIQTLEDNALTATPKSLTLGITTITSGDPLLNILTVGRRIAGNNGTGGYGNIVSLGSSVTTLSITDGGANYTNQSDVPTTTVVGSGSGLRLDFTTTSGAISGTTITSRGNGYAVGDVVSIDNSDGSFTGRDSLLTITAIGGVDTLYLTNVQGEKGSGKSFQVGAGLSYYNTDSTIVGAASTTITDRTSEGTGAQSGNYLRVDHFNHGMYANNNKLTLNGIESDVAPTTLSSQLLSTETTTIQVADSSNFTTFEGLAVSATNKGYVKIGDEIIEYTAAASNQLTINSRGYGNTITQYHSANTVVMKYEFAGISLRRINGITHDISDTDIEANRYYIEIDRSSTYGLDRSADNSNGPELSFKSDLVGGGDKIKASENILYNEINPRFDVNAPGKLTSVSAVVRSTTGTSIDGSETSFERLNTVDIVTLNEVNSLSSARIVCSRVNELNQPVFNNVAGRRSFTAALTLNTEDENLSPIIYLDDSTVEFSCNNLNNPVTNYATDSSVKSFLNDTHTATYVSNVVNLAQPASSLKVLLTAYRHQSADIRVLYSLIRDDSAAVEQEFELFPGYDNLTSTGDGDFIVVDSANNSGRPDVRVPASEDNQFLEYEFTANNLGDFTGYRIKVVMAGTNQAYPPRIRDLRTIALK